MPDNFNIEYKQTDGVLNIEFSGQLTIVSIKKVTESVKSQLSNKPEKVVILADNVENIDITFIQLLKAIKNSGSKNGFDVTYSLRLSDDLSSLVRNAGFEKLLEVN
ncbi:STAS domain-containing protein [Xiashengella succiniciproducens]|jgi:MFS superfamily sulfate permease-like transporter|uniref:STAS domain-containing protein n=1 Tax=Xiashengella succiniciproducens TaxID=2949635 RepID=A0A9J6ZRI2_9BACT|nr:STAS domain-containing protein [Alkaliflexus sp. Ai-910]MDI9539524.1 STAS domain-containing protein [Bacteroidota bacterium]URW79848.1 STAS domain-containing protein [Alkaliflexus sp. Ai-910]HHU00859.1 STAS domain-containing protein [Bacteroidales bacterium]